MVFSSSPLPVKSSVTDQSPTHYLDCPEPLLGCRYKVLANTGGQTLTVIPYNPSYLLVKGAAAFNQGTSGLCAHHQDPHLSFAPLGTLPSPANQPHWCVFTHLELLYFRGPHQKNHLQKVSCWSGGSQQESVSKMGTFFAN